MKRFIIITLITVLLLFSLFSYNKTNNGHVKLLAVSENGREIKGSLADLYLDIKPGTGKVFIDTQPASKLDTQMSTRLAKSIACNFLDADCSGYDFFYTIKADSVIIGGPSASAAIAVMTVALLDGLDIREDVSLTGTITSGNLIGSVAGVKEKIDAAASGGIKIVLIPEESRFVEMGADEKLKIALLGNKAIQNENQSAAENQSTAIQIDNRSIDSQPINKNIIEIIIKNETAKESENLPGQGIKDGMIDLVEYGKQKGVEVIPVQSLYNVMKIMAGKDFEKTKKEFVKDEDYTETMKLLGLILCERSISMQQQFNGILLKKNNPLGAELKLVNGSIIQAVGSSGDLTSVNSIEEARDLNKKINHVLKKQIASYGKDFVARQEQAFNLTQKGQDSFNNGNYYSAASFCFGASVDYKNLVYSVSDMDEKAVKKLYKTLDSDIKNLNKEVNSYKIKTITDLEAYMVVKERLIEASDMLISLNESMQKLNSQKLNSFSDAGKSSDNPNLLSPAQREGLRQGILSQLSFVSERTYSALAWASFFGKSGKIFDFENNDLISSCSSKLSETLEYFQYTNLLLPDFQQDTKKQIEKALGFQKEGNYALCLSKATMAKAQINMFVSTISTNEKEVDVLVEKKIKAVEKAIAGQQEKGIFPVLGYSYLEYAKSLRAESKYSALLYAEYALELSSLDLYFSSTDSITGFLNRAGASKLSALKVRKDLLLIFLSGIMIGLLAAEVYGTAGNAYKKYKIRRIVKKTKIKQKSAKKNNLQNNI